MKITIVCGHRLKLGLVPVFLHILGVPCLGEWSSGKRNTKWVTLACGNHRDWMQTCCTDRDKTSDRNDYG